MIIPVILAGGSGLRLWPASTASRPKQFLRLLGRVTLFQQAALRATLFNKAPIVVTTKQYEDLVLQQLSEVGVRASVVLEPVARNTAPAVMIGALAARNADPLAEIVVMPSDHVFSNDAGFVSSVHAATKAGKINLLGVVPDHPSVDYGYIVPTDPDYLGAVKEFVEKPPREVAEHLIRRNALWNCGVFVGRASLFINLMGKYQPDTHSVVMRAWKNRSIGYGAETVGHEYAEASPKSFDVAVLQNCPQDCWVSLMSSKWSDVGSWRALIEKGAEAANQEHADFHYHNHNGHRVAVGGGLHVCVLGETPLTVVATSGYVFVSDGTMDERLPQMAAGIQPHRVPRPWGEYSIVSAGLADNFRIKKLTVNPRSALSLQSHASRSETWVVLEGKARVTRGVDIHEISETGTIHIPNGVRHRLENVTDKPLVLIEIQTGDYFGEDDITRYSDLYGRA
jgi:mannose-1-phosphate guanylyltransferase / mannose-6-phosphate isomerase